MTWTIVVKSAATAGLRQIRQVDRERAASVVAALRALAIDPTPGASRQLGGTNFRRMSIGDCRVLYELDESRSAIVVHAVGSVSAAE
ncbi:MAG: type II toxin-antitoxin system RelE family toxin [Sporichthyaceae bacterium]